MSQTVIGIFDNASEAQEAAEHLRSAGFSDSNVDVSTRSTSDDNSNVRDLDDDNDSFGSSIGNFFSNLFGSNHDDDARTYSEVAKRGNAIVTVHAQSDDESNRAAAILDECGAVDVDERAEQYRSGNNTGYADSHRTDDTTIPVIEEELHVGKREVESTGGTRLRSKIIERPVEESVRLRSEKVNVERNTVNRPATEADFTNFKEGTIEVTERKEVPIVNKEARVVEEIHLGKEVSEREETIRDTVRSTEVDVEKSDVDSDLDSDDDDNYRKDNNNNGSNSNTGYSSDSSFRRSDRDDDL